MKTTILKLSFVAVFALVLGVATNTKAATIGPDYNSVGFTYQNKGGFSGMLKVKNASERSEINAFETLFNTDDIVIWDKIERRGGSDLGRIALDLDRGNKSGSWSLNSDADDFNPASIVGFAVKAGKYTGYFKFDDAGLDLDTVVAFNSMADYASDLFGDMRGYKDKFFNKSVSHLTVFGSTAIGSTVNTITAVPVPPSVAMMGLALFGFGVLSWRRKRYLGR